MENVGLEDDFSLQGGHFSLHDYGRKGRCYFLTNWVYIWPSFSPFESQVESDSVSEVLARLAAISSREKVQFLLRLGPTQTFGTMKGEIDEWRDDVFAFPYCDLFENVCRFWRFAKLPPQNTRLQICPTYIFGNNPPQMVPRDRNIAFNQGLAA